MSRFREAQPLSRVGGTGATREIAFAFGPRRGSPQQVAGPYPAYEARENVFCFVKCKAKFSEFVGPVGPAHRCCHTVRCTLSDSHRLLKGVTRSLSLSKRKTP